MAFTRTEMYLLQSNHALPAEEINHELIDDDLIDVEYTTSESSTYPFDIEYTTTESSNPFDTEYDPGIWVFISFILIYCYSFLF